MKSPIALLSSLLKDFKRLEPGVKGLDRDIITIQARFEHEGYGFLSAALSTLCDSLDQGLASCQFACPTGFSRTRKGALPKMFSGLLCEVFDGKTGILKQAPNVGAIKCLREVLKLFKKVRLSDCRVEELDKSAKRTFWETDEMLARRSTPDSRLYLLSRASSYVLTRLESFEPSLVKPGHGPGAVFERCSPNQKWSEAARGLLNEEVPFSDEYGFDCFLASTRSFEKFGNTEYSRDSNLRSLSSESVKPGLLESSEDESSGRIARLISVPKNSTSRRTITVEPLLNMFVQQGLNVVLRDEITKCPILKQSLALTDQSKNQELARVGSRTGYWATLDLSSASDLLDNELVKLVFSKKASFSRMMQECRTPYVTSGYETHKPMRVRKFAGMGNALTFPVQSVVFALIAITSILECEGRSPSYWNVKRAARLVRVYGDDIIVPTHYASQVVDWLESCGLKVNRKKSFTIGNFRESCGLDAFRGYDVTPMYIKDEPSKPQMEPKAVAGFVALSNNAWLRGLYNFATSLQEMVEEATKLRFPYVSKRSGSLGWHSRKDACEVHRWNSKLQRPEFRGPTTVSMKRRDELSGNGALLKFFLTPLIQRDKDHLSSSVRRFRSRLKLRWFPSETFD